MRKVLLKLTLFFSVLSFCQEATFKFTKDGFTDYVVTNVDNKTQSELYKKALDWVQITYKNPNEVLKAQIENDYIRIEGRTLELFTSGGISIPANYIVEIYFKDNKYKFDIISCLLKESGSELTNEYGKFFNKNGEVKPFLKNAPNQIEYTFNALNKNLEEFLKSNKKSEW